MCRTIPFASARCRVYDVECNNDDMDNMDSLQTASTISPPQFGLLFFWNPAQVSR